jgi:hypothetical protein
MPKVYPTISQKRLQVVDFNRDYFCILQQSEFRAAKNKGRSWGRPKSHKAGKTGTNWGTSGTLGHDKTQKSPTV